MYCGGWKLWGPGVNKFKETVSGFAKTNIYFKHFLQITLNPNNEKFKKNLERYSVQIVDYIGVVTRSFIPQKA